MMLQYFAFTGIVFLIFYVWKRKATWAAKIQKKYPDNKHIFREIRYSIYTLMILGGIILCIVWANKHHLTLAYSPIDKYGWGYYFFSFVLMIIVHDTYFYWTHRLLHWKLLFKHAHKVHHQSMNPTAFAAYSFHPIEAVVQMGIVPVLVFTIPHHISVVTVFATYSLILNVSGHVGYDYMPKWFVRSKWFNWHNTPTHHNLHHTNFKTNYGLYFNFWDAIMKTNHPHYEAIYDKVMEAREQGTTGHPDDLATKRDSVMVKPVAGQPMSGERISA
ncbi:sterol desaturase family protein [Mucilaginibacter myungsuensis]|uniref:Sterol desaturase family protein n=1 Tax=Mucilaginibacter myungsuensis TaxID=649104 RepID=A0A929L0B4_9SPHI|nr:sterol desaturase family protein [Mucilaginibacter myungsuensis]MBE9661815.1 sterol desaturase family protein [Mucilaginibacter myungsuensis]MDN3599751.1 sterol desaturase family protein [Mucilaginibacter myungsuensis]